MTLHAPWWLPGGHAQTIVPALAGQRPSIAWQRQRWNTPDGDFIDLDWTAVPANVAAGLPLVVLFHGLEGSSSSHYARALMAAVQARGWLGVVVHFRSCSGEINLAPRFYHSGDSNEIAWTIERLHRLHAQPDRRPLYAVGASLGGNALLRYLGERAEDASLLCAAAAVSAPLDLAAGGAALAHGFNRVYTQMFLRTLKRKCEAKLRQYPGLFDAAAMRASCDLHAFDDVVTAPLHGFLDADDYWARASSKPLLPAITVPSLVLNARNDPFLPARYLPAPDQASRVVVLEQPDHGGHVGFFDTTATPWNRRLDWLPQRLLRFFERGD